MDERKDKRKNLRTAGWLRGYTDTRFTGPLGLLSAIQLKTYHTLSQLVHQKYL